MAGSQSDQTKCNAMPVDIKFVSDRLSVLQTHIDLIESEVRLIHQALAVMQSPSLPGLESSQSPAPAGSLAEALLRPDRAA